jgi:predicted RNA-binding Zn ribbon-like protein
MAEAYTQWVPEHFIGGHPALDLANAVFDRQAPAPDNELLKSSRDIGNWFNASGLAGYLQASAVAAIRDGEFVDRVHAVREASFQLFDATAAEKPPRTEPLAFLFSTAAGGLGPGAIDLNGAWPELAAERWDDPDAVTGFLAMLSIQAFFTLPRDRLHACPRCGWLFLDKSRGGKRRWCSMRTCGNREKVSRHRGSAQTT